ncbi:MAG: hypothetical protein FWE71_09380 [Nocardioidaceae bacterium]|nr:hypothetical protein [Nocardioidaceae bacterium]MCL2614979.1 hypothetical protein [Nocardioidaceae bacterium]
MSQTTQATSPFSAIGPGRYRARWRTALPHLFVLALCIYFLVTFNRGSVSSLTVVPTVLVMLAALLVWRAVETRHRHAVLARLRPGATVLLAFPSFALEAGLHKGGYLPGGLGGALFATVDDEALELWPRTGRTDLSFARVPRADIAGIRADLVHVDAKRYGGAYVYDWRAIVVVLADDTPLPLALGRRSGYGVASVAQANALITDMARHLPLLS